VHQKNGRADFLDERDKGVAVEELLPP